MIAATYNCGCPIPRQSLVFAGLQPPCSPCCFRSVEQSAAKDKSKCSIVSRDKNPITRSSRESFRKKFTSGRSDSKSKELDSERIPSEKIASDIVKKGQPYKEIEAIINDNHVIIRTHKEPIKDDYDPPCECVGQDATWKESESSVKKCDDGVSFEMANGTLELSKCPAAQEEGASFVEKSSCEKEAACRTITLYPEAGKGEKPKSKSSTKLEENPNIFILRVRKWCESADRRSRKIDFEFRAPRPWRPQKNTVGTAK